MSHQSGVSETQRSRREKPLTKIVKGGKNVCKRISLEVEVKKVLGVLSCTGLSAEKMNELAGMCKDMDKDLAAAVSGQLSQCIECGKTAVQEYLQMCDQIMKNCNVGESETYIGHARTLKALQTLLESEDLSEEDRQDYGEKMLAVTDSMKWYDAENKAFYKEVLGMVATGVQTPVGGGCAR